MVIFGARTKTTIVAGLFLTRHLCRVTAAQRLHRCRPWFTVFFLPIFAFGQGQDFMACAHCGQATALARPDAQRFATDAAHHEAQRRSAESTPLNKPPAHHGRRHSRGEGSRYRRRGPGRQRMYEPLSG